MPRKSAAPASPTPLRAMQLLGRWTRVSQGHIALGAGCMCGGAMGGVRPLDLELNVLEYLHTRHAAEPAASALLRDAAGYKEGEAGSLAALLQTIARRAAPAPEAVQARLLDDLERTIDSFDAMHRQ